MKSEVKILLYPEEHKSKNGAFFENLMRSVFKTQGYEIQQNINFTGLEIDLYAKHVDRNETLLIECKAKEKPKSTELKNFAFNVLDKEAHFGYFVYTEELDHQAAGLKEEWESKEKYKNLTFFGPEKIIKSLENADKVKPLNLSEIEKYETINKKILAYTYFGIFYIVVPFSGTTQKIYYLFDKNGNQIENSDVIADKEHSNNTSIDKALKNGIEELKKLQHQVYSKQKLEQKQFETKQTLAANKIVKFAVLYPSPIDKNFDFSFNEILNKIEKLSVYIDFYYLTVDNIQEIEGYDYVLIITEVFKNKIYIEDEYLNSKLIDFEEFSSNYIGDAKATIILSNESIDIDKTSLSLIFITSKEKKDFKNSLQNFFFKAFQKHDIQMLLQSENIKTYNITDNNIIKIDKGTATVNYQKTKLSDELESKKFQGFIGRKNDQQNIIRAILELQNSGQIINIKGAGGIGKTTIVCKVVNEISLRGHFKQGIRFVSCEFIQSYKLFEAKIAQCFKLDNIINLREHLSETFSQLDALIILDNFETLLTLEDEKEVLEVKKLVEFISNYSIIVITSREKIGYDFEIVYSLENLTTDEALELFEKNCKIKFISKEDERILRSDIIENLLNNNPLAIKLITRNIPSNKDISELKRELEDDFELFAKTSGDIDKIFDKEADINIERTRSLFQSINYSYQKMSLKLKLAFELLHLFPDGITHKDFKGCFDDKKSNHIISDFEIKSLEDKSLLENNSGIIKLQSIIGRFAKFQFNKRSEEEKRKYYKFAYLYNAFTLNFIKKFFDSNKSELSFKLFEHYSNNLIFALSYLDKVDEVKRYLLNYTHDLSHFILSEGNIVQYLKNLTEIIDYFNDINYAVDFLKAKKISFIYHHKIFKQPYEELQEKYPVEDLLKLTINDKKEDYFKVRYITIALSIHNYEGKTIEFIKWLMNNEIYDVNIIKTALFYLGNFTYIENKIRYYKFEKDLIENNLSINELKSYIGSLFEKNHLEKLQCTYTLSKIERVEFDTIQKLVITNPYSKGLKFLMFAFIEENPNKKIELFEEAIDNLAHIKYYYLEAIYFYTKYLKSINHSDYEIWFTKGFYLANNLNYRFLIHRFTCLKENIEKLYVEKDYPLPDNLYLEDYINKFNEVWGDSKGDNEPLIQKKSPLKTLPKLTVYVEGETDEKYINKAYEIFNGSNNISIVKWIGKKDEKGNVSFTGDTALNDYWKMSTAHPENIKQRTLLLYDSDTHKSNSCQGEIFIRCMPVNQENTLYKRGIENLLTLPHNFPKEAFYNTKEKEKTDEYSAKTKTVVEELNKMKLCEYICNDLNEDEQKSYLKNFNLIFKIIEDVAND